MRSLRGGTRSLWMLPKPAIAPTRPPSPTRQGPFRQGSWVQQEVSACTSPGPKFSPLLWCYHSRFVGLLCLDSIRSCDAATCLVDARSDDTSPRVSFITLARVFGCPDSSGDAFMAAMNETASSLKAFTMCAPRCSSWPSGLSCDLLARAVQSSALP